jgi:hypothetical protein
VKTLAVHCHSDVCSTPSGNSAGCRTSWVYLQHHATVVTSNIVTGCGSKFPPTVSKNCQHQHTAVPQNYTSTVQCQQFQLLWYPKCCFLRPTSWQPLFIVTAFSSLMTLQGLPTYIKHSITQFTVHAGLLRLLPKSSKFQYTTVYFNLCMTRRNVVIKLWNWVTNYECWITAEYNARSRFR